LKPLGEQVPVASFLSFGDANSRWGRGRLMEDKSGPNIFAQQQPFWRQGWAWWWVLSSAGCSA